MLNYSTTNCKRLGFFLELLVKHLNMLQNSLEPHLCHLGKKTEILLFLESQEASSTSFLLNIRTVPPIEIKLEKGSCTGSRTIILAGHISDSELNTLLACSLFPVSWKNEILDNTVQYNTTQPFPITCCSKPLEAVPLLKFSFSQFLVPKEAAKQIKLFKHRVIAKLIWTDVLVNIGGLVFYLIENRLFLTSKHSSLSVKHFSKVIW